MLDHGHLFCDRLDEIDVRVLVLLHLRMLLIVALNQFLLIVLRVVVVVVVNEGQVDEALLLQRSLLLIVS